VAVVFLLECHLKVIHYTLVSDMLDTVNHGQEFVTVCLGFFDYPLRAVFMVRQYNHFTGCRIIDASIMVEDDIARAFQLHFRQRIS
jgi:hypothetical protein